MFSCGFCELFKNNCFVEDLQTACSETPDRSSRPEVFCEKSVLRNFAKFTGKHLFQSLYVNKVARLSYRTPTNDCFLTSGNSSAIRKNNISSRVRRDNNFTSSKAVSTRESGYTRFIWSDDTVEEFGPFCAEFQYFMQKQNIRHIKAAEKQ